MNFELDDVQQQLQGSVVRLLADHYGFAARTGHAAQASGYSRKVWGQFADLGLLALPFAEADGGLGLGPVETMIVMEAFGGALVVEPYLATVILAGGAIRHAAGADQRGALLPGIGEGARILAFGHAERNARYDLAFVETRAQMIDGKWRLDGEKSLVLHGDTADALVVSARITGQPGDRNGLGLFLVEADAVQRRGYATQDAMRAAEIRLDASPAQPIGVPGQAWPALERVAQDAVAALCAEAVGAMAVLVELTVEYLKVRRQFGLAIGSFQALQHRAAEMVVALEQARSMALYATMMLLQDDASARARAIHAAKAQIGQSGKFIGEQAVQLHGGIGMTNEYSVGHYLKRITMIEHCFGNTGYHLTALSDLGGLGV